LQKLGNFLGHVIGKDRVKPDPLQVLAVKEFPRTSKNIKEFLVLAGYYRRFITNYSEITKLLMNLLQKNEKFVWNEAQDKTFTELRDLLCLEPLLEYLDFFFHTFRGNHGCTGLRDRRYIESKNEKRFTNCIYFPITYIRPNRIIPP